MPTHQSHETKSEYWKERIQSWKRSGKSKPRFCLEQGISYHSFEYWHKKERESEKRLTQKDLVPMRLKDSVPRQVLADESEEIKIMLPSGVLIYTTKGFNEEHMQRILKALKTCSTI